MSAQATQAKRPRLLVGLAILGVAYALLATKYYVASWPFLISVMSRSDLNRMLLGPFWFAIELAPVTVVVTLLRLDTIRTFVIVACYQFIMTFAVMLFTPWNIGEFLSLVTLFGWNFILQVPIWGLARLALRLTRGLKT